MSQFGYPNPRAIPQRGAIRTNAPPAVKTIPFDYVFQFSLLGQRGNKVQDVVEISTEGVFVALSVGYSLVLDERRTPQTFGPVINQNTLLRAPSLVPFFSGGSLNKLFINGTPGAEIAVLLLDAPIVTGIAALTDEQRPILTSGALRYDGTQLLTLDSVRSPGSKTGIAALTDEQRPILTSGTLRSDGTLLLTLDPVISPGSKLLIWDRTNNLFGQLFEIGPSNTQTFMTPVFGPDPTTKQLPAAGDSQAHIYGTAGSSVDLTVLKGDGSAPIRRNVITLGASFPFSPDASASGAKEPLGSPLSPGDLLIVGLTSPDLLGVAFSVLDIPRVRLSNLSLGALAAGLERNGADLTRGLKFTSEANSLLAANLAIDQVAAGTLGRIFETGAVAAEDVSFLYSLDASGTGREYQSKPIHNIAGLGIANGDRPFRPFAKPVMFEPKSSVRIQVEELSGPPGTLFIVLQGYKMLGTGRIPG